MGRSVKRVLIVCTGNSCRSVMAEGYLSKRIKEKDIDMLVVSAGTIGSSGFSPTRETIDVMREIGVDVSNYKSSGLSKEVINKADIILTMESVHKDTVLALVPEAEKKVYYLREFEEVQPKTKFITDPIGRSIDFYRETRDIIKKSIEGFLKWLEEKSI